MKYIKSFIQSHKYAILWTIGYTFLMWLILDKMFNFPLFSASAWNKLAHAHLRGFGGFVFGILILAALPLYVATTTVIERTGKPLFSIQIPNWIKKLYTPPVTVSDDKNEKTTESETPLSTPSYDIPRHMPTELHGPYMRAHMRKSYQNITSATAAADRGPATEIITPKPVISRATTDIHLIHDAVPPTAPQPPESATAPVGELPLPTDFDFDIPDTSAFDVPMFKNISFDSETTNTDDTISDKDAPTSGTMANYLNNTKRNFSTDGDLIICNNLAIASHEDPDFWIADEDAWFASGKQRPSPIAALKSAAAHGLKPVLYLGAKNILDLNECISTWQSDGITIIETPDELPN